MFADLPAFHIHISHFRHCATGHVMRCKRRTRKRELELEFDFRRTYESAMLNADVNDRTR